MELQGSQQADRFQHLCDVHLQTTLQLDEKPADLRVDFPVLWPEMANSESKKTLLATADSYAILKVLDQYVFGHSMVFCNIKK